MDEPPKTKRSKGALLIFLTWILFTLGVFAIGYPKVRQAVVESGVLELIQQSSHTETPSLKNREVQIAYISASGESNLFTIQTERRGGSRYHDTFEALFAGPTSEILNAGMVSYINPNTSLIGLTISDNILFVDVSKAYLQSRDLQKAEKQLKATALAFDQIKDLVILVEGEPLPQE